MIVGENARSGDMDVNPTKEKKLTNIRTHSHDESLRLTPPRPLTLESAIEFIAADELVEVTPAVDPAPQAGPARSTIGGASAAARTTAGARRPRRGLTARAALLAGRPPAPEHRARGCGARTIARSVASAVAHIRLGRHASPA